MCDFKCETCGGFVAFSYEDWVGHLVSNGHQAEVGKKLSVRKKWRNEGDSFVLTGITSSNGLAWTLGELGEWISSFGTLTQFLYNEKYCFCVFTLQGCGQMGRERVSSIVNQMEFRGHRLMIKPKSSYGPLDWNVVYDTVDKRQVAPPSSSKDAFRRASKSKDEQVPVTSVPKGTLVFTNKNQSSSNNNNYQQNQKSANTNNNSRRSSKELLNRNSNVMDSPTKSDMATAGQEHHQLNQKTVSDQTVNNVELEMDSSGKKRRRKSKDKKAQREQQQDRDNTETSAKTSREATPRSSGILVPPSSLIPQDQSIKSNDSAAAVQKEVFNFRGGFTPSGRKAAEVRISESSDGSYQPESAVKASSSKPPQQVQVLQRPHDSARFKNSKQKENEAQHQQQNSSRRGQGYGNQLPPGGNPLLPTPSSSHQGRNARPYHHPQQSFALTPVFTSQMSPAISASLSNPALPTSRNPYNFVNMPPFPYFFDLFQKLTDDSFKPQKEMLYKHFQKLTLSQQLEEFFLAQTLPFEEVRLRWQVILDILYLLRQEYPRCELYAFGSILSGLGDFMSDIDIYVDLMGDSTSSHPIDPFQKVSGQQAVDIVKKIIRKSLCPHNKNRFFKSLIPVKSARVPILKLTHNSTLINCDLSFENRLSVQNTKMLMFYLNLDVRIFRFMVLIRYWGKFHHLTGSNHIKNYALTLLVLVYLSTKKYVPPVELLQRLKAEERKKKRNSCNLDEIDGWDASFCDNISVIKQHFEAVSLPSTDKSNNNINYISQSKTLIQMAIEFFDMYANLDFSKNVVCPLLGEILHKEKFYPGSEESLPNSLDRYKSWAAKQPMNRRLNVKSHLCVQDPFVLSFNVGSVTPQGTLLQFQIACAKSLQILKQKNGLTSLLDVFVRLPPHIGDKKFMRTYKTELMGQQIRKEIRTATLGTAPMEENDQPSSSSSSSQTSSYIKLPTHLKPFDKFIDEKGLKQAAKKPRWEIFMDFSLNSQFEDTLVAELTRCRMQNNKRSNLMDALCSLWYEFALDFLKEFFEIGLKLKVINNKASSVESYVSTESNSSDVARASGEEERRRSRWKVKMLSKQEEEKLLAQTPRSPEYVSKLTQKTLELKSPPGVVHYHAVKYQVTYPFWDKRPTLLDKVVKNIKCEEMLQIPVLPSGGKRMKKERKNKERKSKKEKSDEQLGDGSSGFWNCFNPVDLEAKVSEMAYENFKKKGEPNDFREFQFNLLVKLDLSSVLERPEMFILFEKDPSTSSNSNDYLRAVQCLSGILVEAFPRYQVFRLAKWLEMPSPTDATKSNIMPSGNNEAINEKQRKSGNSAAQDDGKENGGEATDKKKSTRSKLEEDLLIPSSSSSTCSENENNDLEDISNDEEDDESNNNSGGDQSENGEEETKEN